MHFSFTSTDPLARGRRDALALPTALLLPIVLVGLLAVGARTGPGNCELVSLGVAPLTDLAGEYAPGVPGGLYPGGVNTRPHAHESAGIAIAHEEVVPRDADGHPEADGIVGMISIGMSNATQEFDNGPWTFKPRADSDPARNPHLVIVDGAQSGQDAAAWSVPDALPWQVLAQRLAIAGVAPAQVQVVWIKQALAEPGALGFPHGAELLRDRLRDIVAILSEAYPNVRLAYVSSRTRAWNLGPEGGNPEPLAYESGFAVRWLIESQLEGDPRLAFASPHAQAPWLSWGPYLWADGEQPRSDGLTWQAADVEGDCTHPSKSGETKAADELLAFFKTDPTATPWFLRSGVVGRPPSLSVTPGVTGGPAPVTVSFAASISDTDGGVRDLVWTFDDGTFASGVTNPTKTFDLPGEYSVHVTLTDDAGNTTKRTVAVVVGGGPWTDLGNGLPGSAGLPLLVANGTLLADDTITLTHLNLPSASTGTIIFGHSAVNAPYKGGVLVPEPMLAVSGLDTGQGTLRLVGRWPAGVPSGLPIYMQTWMADTAAPSGFTATNGVLGITP